MTDAGPISLLAKQLSGGAGSLVPGGRRGSELIVLGKRGDAAAGNFSSGCTAQRVAAATSWMGKLVSGGLWLY